MAYEESFFAALGSAIPVSHASGGASSRKKWQRSTKGGGLIGGGSARRAKPRHIGVPSTKQAWILGANEWGRRDRPSTHDMSPAALLHHGRQLQRAGRAGSTRVNYLHWWVIFAGFCERVGWAKSAEEVPLPVSTEVMLMWVAKLSSKYAASTIGVSLAAVSAIHADHDLASPSSNRAVLLAVEGAARTGPVKGVTDTVVVTPEMVAMFLKLDGVATKGGKRWGQLRLRRAKAMAVTGFVGFLRKGELDAMDRCDVSRQPDGTTLIIKKAKNDAVGRGRSTVIGAEVGDAADAEQTLWDWIDEAGLTISRACTKADWPSEQCMACGPLFPQLVGKGEQVSSKPWGKSAVAAELQGMVQECVRRGWLPPDFQVKRITGISLRRGGNSAAAACGVDSLVRAAQGRWLCTETPDEKYTMLHRSKMVSLATTVLRRGT